MFVCVSATATALSRLVWMCFTFLCSILMDWQDLRVDFGLKSIKNEIRNLPLSISNLCIGCQFHCIYNPHKNVLHWVKDIRQRSFIGYKPKTSHSHFKIADLNQLIHHRHHYHHHEQKQKKKIDCNLSNKRTEQLKENAQHMLFAAAFGGVECSKYGAGRMSKPYNLHCPSARIRYLIVVQSCRAFQMKMISSDQESR